MPIVLYLPVKFVIFIYCMYEMEFHSLAEGFFTSKYCCYLPDFSCFCGTGNIGGLPHLVAPLVWTVASHATNSVDSHMS